MTEQEVVFLMESSTTPEEWGENCAKVKKVCDGYPEFWYEAIILSGLADRIVSKWGGSSEIQMITIS